MLKSYHIMKKLYQGSYNFYRRNDIYSKESFEIYRDSRSLNYNFTAQIDDQVHRRGGGGGALKISLNYVLNREFVPMKVHIIRHLGEETASEFFEYNSKKEVIDYIFSCSQGDKTFNIAVTPQFHIATPFACTSMLFTRSKKFDMNSENIYKIIMSQNQWRYKRRLMAKVLSLRSLSLIHKTLHLTGNDLQTIEYRLSEHDDRPMDNKNLPSLYGHMIRPLGIPYSVCEGNDTWIQIKDFQNLAT